jgi:hypothetical protein
MLDRFLERTAFVSVSLAGNSTSGSVGINRNPFVPTQVPAESGRSIRQRYRKDALVRAKVA